jgi:glycosyltransferase involved in cell wall biosynthesis
MKKILIDLTQLPKQGTGVKYYALNLILGLDDQNEYILLIQKNEECFDKINKKNIKKLKLKYYIFRIFIFRIILEQIYLPYLAIKYRLDAIHSLHYSFPIFSPCKKIVTCMDMSHFKCPEYHEKKKVIYVKFFTNLLSKYADKVIFISKSSMFDFVQTFPKFDQSKAKLIYINVKKDIKTKLQNYDDNFLNFKIKKKKYLLYVGTVEPRKNISNLIRAFKYFRNNKDLYLVIAGKIGWFSENIKKILERKNKRIIYLNYISEDFKNYLFKNALAFIYPSFYEGFGIPLIEAFYYDLPTIASNNSSMKEVVNNSSFKINSQNHYDIIMKLKLILENEKIYLDIQQKIRIRSKYFNRMNSNESYSEIYRNI